MSLLLILSIGSGVGQPLSMTISYERSPAGRTGEVTGLRLTFNNISRIVIPLASGTLGAALGVAPVYRTARNRPLSLTRRRVFCTRRGFLYPVQARELHIPVLAQYVVGAAWDLKGIRGGFRPPGKAGMFHQL